MDIGDDGWRFEQAIQVLARNSGAGRRMQRRKPGFYSFDPTFLNLIAISKYKKRAIIYRPYIKALLIPPFEGARGSSFHHINFLSISKEILSF
jgi:hypothetical protein